MWYRKFRFYITGTDKENRRLNPIYTDYLWNGGVYKGTLWEGHYLDKRKKVLYARIIEGKINKLWEDYETKL